MGLPTQEPGRLYPRELLDLLRLTSVAHLGCCQQLQGLWERTAGFQTPSPVFFSLANDQLSDLSFPGHLSTHIGPRFLLALIPGPSFVTPISPPLWAAPQTGFFPSPSQPRNLPFLHPFPLSDLGYLKK